MKKGFIYLQFISLVEVNLFMTFVHHDCMCGLAQQQARTHIIVNFWLGQPMCKMHSCPTTKDISVAIPVIDETKSIYVPKEECAACMPLSYLK